MLQFDSHSYTLLLPVSRGAVAEGLELLAGTAQTLGIEPKEEFHITIVGFGGGKKIKSLYERSAPAAVREVEQALVALAESVSWSFELLPDFYEVQKEYVFKHGKERRHSIVQLVALPGMAVFYTELNRALGQQLTLPLPHVTLFAKGGKGIGIDSQTDFERLNPVKINL